MSFRFGVRQKRVFLITRPKAAIRVVVVVVIVVLFILSMEKRLCVIILSTERGEIHTKTLP